MSGQRHGSTWTSDLPSRESACELALHLVRRLQALLMGMFSKEMQGKGRMYSSRSKILQQCDRDLLYHYRSITPHINTLDLDQVPDKKKQTQNQNQKPDKIVVYSDPLSHEATRLWGYKGLKSLKYLVSKSD
jgi:hypothetical protein